MSVHRGFFSLRLTGARIAKASLLFAAVALPTPCVLAAQMVTVGRNIHVSVARPNDSHSEVILAADPKNAGRLLAGVHIAFSDTVGTKSIAYASFDSGKTWSVSLERRDSTITADAAVAYGPDGSAYFATLARWGLYRSRDGGHTWDPPSKAPPAYAWDREYLVADFTGGKYHGRVYMNATVFPMPAYVADTTNPAPGGGGGGRENAVGLYTSTDGGSTFGNPITRLVSRPEGILGMANNVVLSDGTMMILYGHRKPNAAGGGGRLGIAAFTPLPAANYWLEVITSTDGGETLNNAYRIGDYWMNRPRSEGAVIPHLAVDPGSPLFKDRLYVVWSDFRSNRLEILFSYSSDKGRTWSTPVTISDDRATADALKNGPDNITPTVAVNKDGVVAVSWHDRRDFADNLGWNVRFRASLDGGETWMPSVKVSDKPTAFGGSETWVAASGGGGAAAGRGGRGAADSVKSGGRIISLNARLSNANFTFAPGHNGAFAADAAGGFHPMWIDNRTGMFQVWTATVTVAGQVARNGGGDLADLQDLSTRANLDVVKSTYDRQTNRLTLRTRLRNMSKTDTLVGPLKARALNVTSQVANVEVVNADNRMRGPGAVWDFTSLLTNGQLLPEALSAPKDLIFQLSDLRPFQEGIELRLGLVSIDAKILGPGPTRRARRADRSGQ